MQSSDHENTETAEVAQMTAKPGQKPRTNENQAGSNASKVICQPHSSRRSTPQAPNSNAPSTAEESSSGVSKPMRVVNRAIQLGRLLHEQGDEYTPHIRSEADLEDFEEALQCLNANQPRSHLSAGYPETKDGFAEHCHLLFNAMKNLVDIDDATASPANAIQAGSPAVKDSIAVRFLKSKSPIEFIIVAAKLMRAIRKAQLGRLRVAGRYIQEYDNFTLRFRAVVDALKPSKLLARSAFDSDEWVNRIALNPSGEHKLKKQNAGINAEKKEKQRYATMMRKQDPKLNFKGAANIAAAAEPSAPAATPEPPIQAQHLGQNPADPSDRDWLQMKLGISPAERPSKRAKTSHDRAKEQAGHASDGKSAIDPDPMNVPWSIRKYGSELPGRNGTAGTPQPRNDRDGLQASVPDDTEEAQYDDAGLYSSDD